EGGADGWGRGHVGAAARQGGLDRLCEVGHLDDVRGVDGDAVGHPLHPGVAGGAIDLLDEGTLADLPDERMLATAIPNDQYLHTLVGKPGSRFLDDPLPAKRLHRLTWERFDCQLGPLCYPGASRGPDRAPPPRGRPQLKARNDPVPEPDPRRRPARLRRRPVLPPA